MQENAKSLTAEEIRIIRTSGRRSKHPQQVQPKKLTQTKISIPQKKINYCSYFEKPCCSRKTGICKLTKENCTTDGIKSCGSIKEKILAGGTVN